jgi:hypothetical protein
MVISLTVSKFRFCSISREYAPGKGGATWPTEALGEMLVLNETHNGNSTEAVQAAEAAIFLRSQELDGQGDETEREEMKAASADLLTIKVHKVGWPAPKTTR